MTAPELLQSLRAREITLTAIDGRLEYDAPPGVITPKVLETIRTAKPALLELLREEAPPWDEPAAWEQIRAAYRAIGVDVPGGALTWAETFAPELLVAWDVAEAAWDAAYQRHSSSVLAAALEEFMTVGWAIASAFREAHPPALTTRQAAFGTPDGDEETRGGLRCRETSKTS